jgi:hypothetical protein
MARAGHNPFDKGPAEGSRDVVERELTRHQRADVANQRGAVNRACDGKKAKE